MHLEQLRGFVKAVEAGSFAGAADRLDVPRSQISRWMAQLEAELGVQLLERSTRSQSLTAVGREVYERALAILHNVEDTLRVTQRTRAAPSGLLRVCCSVEFGMETVAGWVEQYLARHPAVSMEVEFSSRELDLLHEGFDLALRAGAQADSRLVARRLGELHHGLFASPAYLAGRGAPQVPEDLGEHALIGLAGSGPRTQWALWPTNSESAKPHTVALQPRLRVNAGSAVRSAALQGLGIAMLPQAMAARACSEGRLAPVLPGWRPAPVPVYAVFPSVRYLTPTLRGFIELAAREFPR